MDIKEFIVGETIYAEPTGNAVRHWDGNLIEMEVIKVKRKYVELLSGGQWKSSDNYCPKTGCMQSEINSGYINTGYRFYKSLLDFVSAKNEREKRKIISLEFNRGIPKWVSSELLESLFNEFKDSK